jgi:hypothetical protein
MKTAHSDYSDDQLVAIVTESIPVSTPLYSSATILPKLLTMDDSQPKPETKTPINAITDDIKVKVEPIESEEDQQSIQSPPSNIKSEASLVPLSTSKLTETKKLHRKFTFSPVSLSPLTPVAFPSADLHLRRLRYSLQ